MQKNRNYCPSILVEKKESQFLDSRPRPTVSAGIILMTGKGIDAEVDDLGFLSNTSNNEKINLQQKEKEKNPTLVYKLRK